MNMIFFILLAAVSGISFREAATPARTYSLSPCKSTGLIYDRNWKIVKGVCEINIAYTYDGGVAACAQHGMDLFFAEDQYVYNSFLDYLRPHFGRHVCGNNWPRSCGLYINGKKSSDGKWYATINGQQQEMDVSFYKWVYNYGLHDPGNCMSVKNQNGLGETAWNCARAFGPICEYNNIYQPPATPAPPIEDSVDVNVRKP